MRLRAAIAAPALLVIGLAGCAQRLPPPPVAEPAIVSQLPVPPVTIAPPPVVTPAPPVTRDYPDGMELLSFAELQGWTDGDHTLAFRAFQTACDKITDVAADTAVGGWREGGAPVFGLGRDWSPICTAARKARESNAGKFIEEWFQPVSIGGAGDGAALFTAYFEPELNGSRQRGGPYQTPIYAKPADIGSRDPYFARAEINRGALAGRGLELFWIDDPVAAFFLEIQGSGRVRLPDGTVTRVGYAGKNGHPYKAIGRTLIDWEEMTLDEVSTASIKSWMKANPQRAVALMESNPSYVFFQERPELAADPTLGPIGSFGQPIPAQRGIAVDREIYPLGIPVWVSFESPVGPIRRLTVALDTGGAIKGPRRADYFFGSGRAAGIAAGETRSEGRLIAFAPRSAIKRLPKAGT